ncbi:MAG: hypothetical protein KAY90_01995 [Arenimonas sp.]|nr:hypothetical protein [Arenimonas sp.]
MQKEFKLKRIFLVLSISLLVSCSSELQENSNNKPQTAGKPLNQAELIGRMATLHAAAATGNQEVVQAQVKEMANDFRKSIKLADPAQAVDREAARNVAKTVDGVRSVVWFDRENLFAIVERNEQKSYETIDAICMKLEPLGDTLGVVVNLQSGAATTGDELEILSRNCQLAPGDRAMLQKNRQIDVISPEIRKQHKANNAR